MERTDGQEVELLPAQLELLGWGLEEKVQKEEQEQA
jgi:hypothetical protein